MSQSESEVEWNRRLVAEGVLWEYPGNGPHAGFSIGARHSGNYFNSDVLFEKPVLHEEIAQWFSERIHDRSPEVDAVVAKPPFSSRLAVPFAELLSIPLIKFGVDELADAKRVVLFADDIYSGGLIGEILDVAEARSIKVAEPICIIANYSGQDSFRGYKLLSLVRTAKPSPAWMPNECPLCKNGSPVLPARNNWKRFIA